MNQLMSLSEAIENREWNIICNNSFDIKEFNTDGKTALYCACLKDAPKNVIEYLYNNYPNATMMEDKISGWSPLHCSVANNCNEEVILYLLKVEPSAAFIPNDFENTPLHSAIIRRLPFHIIQALVECDAFVENKEISSFVNFRGENPLDTFLKVWYFPIKNFLQTKTAALDSLSPSEIMDMEIIRGGKSYSIRYLYNVSYLLYSQTFNDKQRNKEEISTSKYHDSPKKYSSKLLYMALALDCPWVFFEFFMHLHPEQINPIMNDLPFFLMHIAQKTEERNKDKNICDDIFKCIRCKRFEPTLYTMSAGDGSLNYCKKCLHVEFYKGGISDKFIVQKYDYEIGKTQAIYKLLRECPMCVHVSTV